MIYPIGKRFVSHNNNRSDCKCTTDIRLWCRWFCDMRDDEETTWELRSELLFLIQVNTSLLERNGNSPSSHHHHRASQTHKNISKSISSEWRVKNWFNRIHYFLFPFLNYKNPSRDINKNAQENDEERRGEASSITHTYAQTWKPGVWWCWWWWLYK